jgi:hypothetical protein
MPPNKPPRKNPNDELAKNKKFNEAIKKYGNIFNYNEAIDDAHHRSESLADDFFDMGVDQAWKDLWDKQQKESMDKFDSGDIDGVESYERDIRWLKDAIRKIKAGRQVASVDLDDMIMDLESKVENPQGSGRTRKNPRNQTAMDKMMESEIKKFGDLKKLDDAIDGECDIARELHREWLEMTPQGEWVSFEKMSSKLSDRYESGEISLLEKFKLENQWLRDDMLRRTRLRTVQDVDLDDMIMDLESKVENPQGSGRARKNPPNEDGRTLQERLEEAREALEASVGGDLRELKDEFILKANRRYPNWDINDMQKIKYYQYLRELHKGEVSDELLNEIITDLEDKIRNPQPTRRSAKRRRNPMGWDAMEKKRQESIDRLGGEDKYDEAMEDAMEKQWAAKVQLSKMLNSGDVRLFLETFYDLENELDEKIFSGEIGILEATNIGTQYLIDAMNSPGLMSRYSSYDGRGGASRFKEILKRSVIPLNNNASVLENFRNEAINAGFKLLMEESDEQKRMIYDYIYDDRIPFRDEVIEGSKLDKLMAMANIDYDPNRIFALYWLTGLGNQND